VLNISIEKMLVILIVALVVFGPNKLPEIARSVGKFLRNFQAETGQALSDLKDGIEPATTGIFDEPDPGTPTEKLSAGGGAAAAAFGAGRATAKTRRNTSARKATTRLQPSATAKKKKSSTTRSTAAARKRPATRPATKNKPKSSKGR